MNPEKSSDSSPQENPKMEQEEQVGGKVEEEQLYSDFNKKRRVLIIVLVTLAGLLGPIAGNIYSNSSRA